jgi:hypothetical protein
MSYDRKVGDSALFKNSRNSLSDVDGQVELECECGKKTGYFINGWRKETANGTRYLALKFKTKGLSAPKAAARDTASGSEEPLEW